MQFVKSHNLTWVKTTSEVMFKETRALMLIFLQTRGFDVNIFRANHALQEQMQQTKKNSIDVVSRSLLGEWNCEEVEKVIEKAYETIEF